MEVMTTVGVRELKSCLSAYLRRVRAGEAVVITDRGQAIAEIVPAGWRESHALSPEASAMVRAGTLRLPSQPRSRARFGAVGRLRVGSAQQLLDEDRGRR